MIDVARNCKMVNITSKREYNGCGQKRAIQRIWPDEENLSDMARRG